MNDPGAVALIACLRSVMRYESGLEDRVLPVAVPAPAAFDDAVARHRVAQVLAPHASALGLAEEVAEAVRAQADRSKLTGMLTAAGTAQVSRMLASGAVPHLVIKGAALAVQTTGAPEGRGGGDIDILVAPGSIARAVEVLERSGVMQDRSYAPTPSSPLFPATLRTQQELLLHHRGFEVDLHWRLDCARGCLAWRFDELRARADAVQLGGVEVLTLSRCDAAVLNASNATRDGWSRLRAVVDQLRLLRDGDVTQWRAWARRSGAGARFDLSLLLAARLLQIEPPTALPSAKAWADRTWRWLLRGEEPSGKTGLRPATRLSAAHFLSYDNPRMALSRTGTWVWPVRAMAVRELGGMGDAHPWLYPAATPYFASRRALERVGMKDSRR